MRDFQLWRVDAVADGVVCRISISPQCGFASVFEGNPLTEEVSPTFRCTAIGC